MENYNPVLTGAKEYSLLLVAVVLSFLLKPTTTSMRTTVAKSPIPVAVAANVIRTAARGKSQLVVVVFERPPVGRKWWKRI